MCGVVFMVANTCCVIQAIIDGCYINTMKPIQNGCLFANDMFKCIFFIQNVRISLRISLKFVPKGPINNIAALVQIMAWPLVGAKLLSEPMMVRIPMHVSLSLNELTNFGLRMPYGNIDLDQYRLR